MWAVLLPKVSEHLGAWATIFAFLAGTFAFLGWDSPPYAGQRRVETIEQTEQKAKQERLLDRRVLLDLQRGTWEQRRQRAQTELMKNPDSQTAQETIDNAARAIGRIDKQIARIDRQTDQTPND